MAHEKIAQCVGCGCTDDHACTGRCWWLRVDRGKGTGVCSECEEFLLTWDKGDHTHNSPSYDRYGRMNYSPEYHPNHGKEWTTTDQAYLIENYESLGPEQISFALGRTIHTVMTRAHKLRRDGVMKKAGKKTYSRRLRGTP